MAQEGNLQSRDTYINALAQSLAEGQSLANVPGLIKKIIKNEMWRERVVHQTKQVAKYNRFLDFIQDYAPEGLHTKPDVLMKICQSYGDMEAVDLLAQASAGKPGGNNNPNGLGGKSGKTLDIVNVDIINIDKEIKDRPTGTSSAATMRRLAKDFPAFHEQVLAGELTPNAAAREAGFRRRNLQIPDDPVEAAQYFLRRKDAGWIATMVDVLIQDGGV